LVHKDTAKHNSKVDGMFQMRPEVHPSGNTSAKLRSVTGSITNADQVNFRRNKETVPVLGLFY
jgi:hypothetical protein